MKLDKGTIELDNYNIHKQLYAKLEPDQENLKKKLNQISKWFVASGNQFYMLMCKEISYYTVFDFEALDDSVKREDGKEELRKTLAYRGSLVDISYVAREDAFECWIKTPEGNIEMYYLFPYDFGVVKILDKE